MSKGDEERRIVFSRYVTRGGGVVVVVKSFCGDVFYLYSD